MRKLWICAIFVIFAVAPSGLAAQACIGSHASHGQAAVSPSMSFTDGAMSYGIVGGGFTESPAFIGAGYSRTELDNVDMTGNSLGVSGGAELPGPELSVCPVASFSYTWLTNVPVDGDLDGIDLGAGLSIGQSFGEEFLFTPHATASVVHNRSTVSFGGTSSTQSQTGGRFAGGFVVGSPEFFAGPSVSIATFEGSDPIFSISAGITF